MPFRSLAVMLILAEVSHPTAGFLVVTDPHMTRMVSFRGPGHNCVVSENRTEIMSTLLTSSSHNTIRAGTAAEMDRLMQACQQHMAQYKPGSAGGFVYPGTKWCGPGDVASSYDDLGPMVAEDKCCREHDNCPMSIPAFQCKSGVCNNSPFTRSECKCDRQFQRCLRKIHSTTADTIGALYFNIARIMCYNDPIKCQQDPSSCQYSLMPLYKSDDLRTLKNLLTQVFQGVLRLKLALKTAPLRLLDQKLRRRN